ncbi:MAG: type I restriction endonuclease subunit R, partial [Epsilonproteobacteria bacterium]|nr:type I restriction endonuclease subunit R [Campylobacterota bacterium]
MRSQTNEEALESHIEKVLLAHGFYKGENRDFNKDYAIDEKIFWDFLETTQKEELEKLKRDSQYKLKIIQRLDKMIKKHGIIKILKKGLDVDDAHLTLFYIAPLAS